MEERKLQESISAAKDLADKIITKVSQVNKYQLACL